MSTSYDICVYCCISNRTGATSGAGTGDYLYVCTFVYVIHCTGSIPDLKKMLRILMSNTMSILDDIFVCCLLITGVVQLVEQELFTISDVTPLFYIICSFLLLIVCFCSFSVDHCIVSALSINDLSLPRSITPIFFFLDLKSLKIPNR
jgi:hypothetical protein